MSAPLSTDYRLKTGSNATRLNICFSNYCLFYLVNVVYVCSRSLLLLGGSRGTGRRVLLRVLSVVLPVDLVDIEGEA